MKIFSLLLIIILRASNKNKNKPRNFDEMLYSILTNKSSCINKEEMLMCRTCFKIWFL